MTETSIDRGHTVLIFGPPGCGKTTAAARHVKATAQARGADKVMVVSFTRTAAQEIKGRDLPLPDRNVGTLHSMAYRSIDSPTLAFAEIADWNRRHPQWAMKGTSQGTIEEAPAEWVGASEGEKLLGEADILRAKMIPEDQWPKMSVRSFYRAWTEWKTETETVDFQDMIERALNEVDEAPAKPQVAFLDEAQDATALEIALFRKWGAKMDRIVLLGDDDQAIFRFRGADPKSLIDLDIPETDKIVLGQSYRVPERVLEVADSWVHTLSHRAEKVYLPRDAEGDVRLSPNSFDAADDLVREMRSHLDEGKSVMAMAACGYQLDGIKKELRRQGVPFSNPWRPTRGDWNPLGQSTARSTSSSDRLLAYLIMDEDAFGEASRLWTGGDVKRWSKFVNTKGVFRRGARGAIEKLPDRELDYEDIAALFSDAAELEQAVQPSLDWYASHLTAEGSRALEFPIQVYRQSGPKALTEPPRLYLGTVHCSPPDEPILTTDGWVPIGLLDPRVHRLASHDRKTNRMAWGCDTKGNPQGYGFTKSTRHHEGNLITMKTAETFTRVTPDHRVLASFGDNFVEKWVVYIMRKGNLWRIGHCVSGHRPYRSGGLGGRLSTEQADCGWILGVCETKSEATILETTLQGRYGIPGLTFRSSGASKLTHEEVEGVHRAVAPFVEPRALALLADFGLDPTCPLWTRSSPGGSEMPQKRRMRAIFLTEAANLVPLSGYVSIPWATEGFIETREKSRVSPIMLPATIETEPYDGPVFGLDVLPYHYYVSGGAVVHNSFKGSEADVTFVCPDLSLAGAREWDSPGEVRDSVIRQFYVAMTRARETLVICEPSSRMHVPIRDFVKR